MTKTKTTRAAKPAPEPATDLRTAAMGQALRERRREIEDDLQNRVRDGRAARLKDGHDTLESSEADIQSDIELAVLQMKTEMLVRIDAALGRLAAGKYGLCFECSGEIAERRLRAVPFAVRCQSCEQSREQTQTDARQQLQRRDGYSAFAGPTGP